MKRTPGLDPELLQQSFAPPPGPSASLPFSHSSVEAPSAGLVHRGGPGLNATAPGMLGLTLPCSSVQQPERPGEPCQPNALIGPAQEKEVEAEPAAREDAAVPDHSFSKPLPMEHPAPDAHAPPPCPAPSSAAALHASMLASSLERNPDPVSCSSAAPHRTPGSRASISAAQGLASRSYLNSSTSHFSFHQHSFREQ